MSTLCVGPFRVVIALSCKLVNAQKGNSYRNSIFSIVLESVAKCYVCSRQKSRSLDTSFVWVLGRNSDKFLTLSRTTYDDREKNNYDKVIEHEAYPTHYHAYLPATKTTHHFTYSDKLMYKDVGQSRHLAN